MALQFAITECFKFESPSVVANEMSFTRKDYEAVLCNELGHLISLTRNLRRPSNSFLKLLRDEAYADREGFILYFRARRNKWGYATLFTGNFRELLIDIKRERDAGIWYKRIKSFVINIMRLLIFFGYELPTGKNGPKHVNELPLHSDRMSNSSRSASVPHEGR